MSGDGTKKPVPVRVRAVWMGWRGCDRWFQRTYAAIARGSTSNGVTVAVATATTGVGRIPKNCSASAGVFRSR